MGGCLSSGFIILQRCGLGCTNLGAWIHLSFKGLHARRIARCAVGSLSPVWVTEQVVVSLGLGCCEVRIADVGVIPSIRLERHIGRHICVAFATGRHDNRWYA